MTARRTLNVCVVGIAALVWSLAAVAAEKPLAFPGTYANEFGTVTITQTAEGFDVDISTAEPSSGRWVCDFSGSGMLDGKAIVIDYRGEPGTDTAADKVTVTLQKNMLTVRETRSAQIVDFCGFNGFIGGDYRRKVKR